MEYLELKSFDSIEIINACDMNNILGAGFGESIAKVQFCIKKFTRNL